MSDVNVVSLTGGLTRDPELSDMGGRGSALRFGLGVGESFKGADGQVVERSHYVDVEVFGRRAESLAQILRKGMRVAVSGKLRFSSWQAQDGSRRSKLTVVASEVVLPPKGAQRDAQEPRDALQAAQCPQEPYQYDPTAWTQQAAAVQASLEAQGVRVAPSPYGDPYAPYPQG